MQPPLETSIASSVIDESTCITLGNFAFLVVIIIVGALLGSTLRTGKTTDNKPKNEGSSHVMVGIGSAFICVPFIASFLHLNYQSLLLPLRGTTPATFIEQIFMLISLSGIASYLGYGLLDNIANKVLQSQVNDLDKEQKETKHSVASLIEENKQIKSNERKMSLELLYMKAKDAVESGQRFGDKFREKGSEEDKVASLKKYSDALKFLDDGLQAIDEKEDYNTFDRFMVLKAYTLKRLDRTADALLIVKKLLEKDENNPVLLYNLGCYLYLTKQHKTHDEVKDLIIKALTINPIKEAHIPFQKKLIEKVLATLDEDIKDLFDDEELSRIREMTSAP